MALLIYMHVRTELLFSTSDVIAAGFLLICVFTALLWFMGSTPAKSQSQQQENGSLISEASTLVLKLWTCRGEQEQSSAPSASHIGRSTTSCSCWPSITSCD